MQDGWIECAALVSTAVAGVQPRLDRRVDERVLILQWLRSDEDQGVMDDVEKVGGKPWK